MTSQIYMDDIILVLRGPSRHRNHILAMVLYMLNVLGVQIALEKGERGQERVGLELHSSSSKRGS